MSITLNRGLATEYSFPQNRFSLDQLPWMRRFSEAERAYQHGSVVTSDSRIKSRPGRIWGTISFSTRAAFRTALEQLRAACAIEDPTLHADEFWPDRYVNIRVKNVDGVYYPNLMAGEVEVLFQAIDPFWYSDTLSSVITTLTSQPQFITITNNGEMETVPLITYTAGAAQMRVRLRNNSDGNRELDYQATLGLNDVVILNAANGTVTLNGTTHIEKLTGAWWNLVVGANVIRVGITGAIGAASTLQIQWRERYL